MIETIGYQIVGRKFGPTLTIWRTKQQAERYLKNLKSFEDTWRIIEVIIKN